MRSLALLCAGVAAAPAQEIVVAERAFVETRAPRSTFFVHEKVQLTVRFGIEHGLRDRLIQLHRQRLDVPVRIDAPFLDGIDGTLPHGPPRDAGFSLVVNTGLGKARAAGDEPRGGETFAVFEIERAFLPERAGRIALAAPRLELAYATRFREDFLNGRVPEDRHDAAVAGEPIVLTVEPLPEAGRPPGYSGAVGTFTVRVDVEPTRVAVGESLRLRMRIEGDGNPGHFDPPVLRLRGFHVQGRIDDKGAPRRTITWDVTPLAAGLREVPAVPFSFFDPGARRYRTILSAPAPISVRPGTAPPGLVDSGPRPGIDDIHDVVPVRPGDAGRGRRLSFPLLLLGVLAPWLAALGFVSWRRARARRVIDPATLRARAAATSFRAATAVPDHDLRDAFADYLAARSGASAPAVIAPDLHERLIHAGIPPALAERARAVLDGLVAKRYGGTAAADRVETSALVEDLEAAFATAERGP